MVDIFEQVAALISEQTGARRSAIREHADLVADLRIDGDDLAELMDAYFTKFRVDKTSFDPTRYVPDEGFSLFRKPRPVQPITVSMLVQGVQSGRWPDQ